VEGRRKTEVEAMIAMFDARIRAMREFAGTRADWVKDDGAMDTLFWGELYRRMVPKEARYKNLTAGPITRKREVKRELRRRIGVNR
jgi:hypothetical protein